MILLDALKGETRPIVREEDRAALLSALVLYRWCGAILKRIHQLNY